MVVGGIYVGVEAFAGMADTQRAMVSEFEDVYRSYRDWAVQLAWSLCHDESVAEDVAQDAFIALFRCSGMLRRRSRICGGVWSTV